MLRRKMVFQNYNMQRNHMRKFKTVIKHDIDLLPALFPETTAPNDMVPCFRWPIIVLIFRKDHCHYLWNFSLLSYPLCLIGRQLEANFFWRENRNLNVLEVQLVNFTGRETAAPNYMTMLSLLKNLCKNFIRRASMCAARLVVHSPPLDFGLHTSRSQEAKKLGLPELSNFPHKPILLALSTISMAPSASLRARR
jgi:hypothetical protein